MVRSASVFVCQSCGAQTNQFFGRCSSCGSWNTLVEQKLSLSKERNKRRSIEGIASSALTPLRAESISALATKPIKRLSSGYREFDRVLGGGLVPGSLVLVGGDPGIGKSTLLLQSASLMAGQQSVLYVTAEESAQQVKLRWQRLQITENDLQILAETDLDLVLQEIELIKPDVVIIDSIQALNDENLTSASGSVAQVRECASALQRLAKKQNVALLLVGHVTKEGILAGPKVLEHLVDAVLTFEGDRFANHRVLRAIKNRFGATFELGIFEMQGSGLIEVENPSELFLGRDSAAGVATIVTYEGTRSLVVELQALVSGTSYASPRRTATGIETNRLHQILAVLEKHLGLPLSRFDCYLAVAGGLDIDEPAADLGIAAAIVSSFKEIKLPKATIFLGELGLGGQLRQVGQLSQRLNEAHRLGFKRAVVPKVNIMDSTGYMEFDGDLIKASSLAEAVGIALDS